MGLEEGRIKWKTRQTWVASYKFPILFWYKKIIFVIFSYIFVILINASSFFSV